MDKATRVERLAERAVEKAARSFTVTKFGRHEDGYLHCRVTPAGGKPIYVNRRFGSWMAPGTIKGRALMKELEALVGAHLGYEIKVELQRRARALERAEREARMAHAELTIRQAARVTLAVFGPEETERALKEAYGLSDAEITTLMQQIQAQNN